ncbi:MAG: glycosyltransferase family 39 protein [Pseudomonadota bacterium]|nr:glycosyltransferase family 39 protein [Pseudomonadota bacterium]
MPAVGATSVSESRSRWTPTDRMVLLALILVAVARSLAIMLSPLELGVDEAQYWLWSTRFDFGYYTKPPLTSWIIGASHAVFGHHVWAVRLPAPWIHLATALVLWRAGCWLGGNAAGRWAALLWASLPAVAVGSFVISTDTPMLLFWSLGLLALVGATTGNLASRRAAMMAGAAFGAAMLSKYAAIFGVVGLALYWLPARFRARPSLAPADLVLFAVAMLVIASPNIIWNLANDLTTVRHLGDNANLDRQSYAPLNSLWFLAAQFATAGPVSFALMLGILRVRRGDDAGTLLLCLSVPVIAVIMLQAFLSEANANWALAAMPALVLWLARWLAAGASRPGVAALAVNGAICLVLVAVTIAGSLGPLTPQSDPLRRLRGWQQLADNTATALAAHRAQTVVTDRRAAAALLSWHFYETGVEVLIHDADGIPSNHFETNTPWTPRPGRRLVALTGRSEPPAMEDVAWPNAGGPPVSDTPISRNRNRTRYLHSGIEAD